MSRDNEFSRSREFVNEKNYTGSSLYYDEYESVFSKKFHFNEIP